MSNALQEPPLQGGFLFFYLSSNVRLIFFYMDSQPLSLLFFSWFFLLRFRSQESQKNNLIF